MNDAIKLNEKSKKPSFKNNSICFEENSDLEVQPICDDFISVLASNLAKLDFALVNSN
jgi:hypothetical protein